VSGARVANPFDVLPEEMFARILRFIDTPSVWARLKQVRKDIAEKMGFEKTANSWGMANAKFTLEFESDRAIDENKAAFVRKNKKHILRVFIKGYPTGRPPNVLLQQLFHDSEITRIEAEALSYALFDFIKNAKKLKHLHVGRDLDYINSDSGAINRLLEFAEFIKSCRFLKSLKFRGSVQFDPVLSERVRCIVESTKACTNLKELEMLGSFDLSEQDTVQIFESNRRISKFSISSELDSSSTSERKMSSSNAFFSLTELLICSGADALKFMRVSPRLKNVNIVSCSVSTETLKEILECARNLQRLCMIGVNLSDFHMHEFGKFFATPNKLSVLNLQKCNISAVGAVVIARALASDCALTEVNLSHNKIESRGGYAIAKSLLTNASLTRLYLIDSAIGSVGLCAFAATISANKTLRKLDLSHNPSIKYDPSKTGLEYPVVKELATALKSNATLEQFLLIPTEALHPGEIVKIACDIKSSKIFAASGLPEPDIDAQFYC